MRERSLIHTTPAPALRFLYHTALGRGLLKLLIRPAWSKAAGWFLDRPLSKRLIPGFIRKNNIDLSRYEERDYRSYNDFFTRRLKEEYRNLEESPEALISPCDAKLTAFRISQERRFDVKNTSYTVEELLRDATLAERFSGGICLIFRLTVSDYHRYCYLDDGEKEENRFIRGVLHTVQPVALGEYPVFVQNCRETTILHTKNFGTVAQIEVGALFVGRILNLHQRAAFRRGEEKGRFEFGGSTIVLLLEPGAAVLDDEIWTNTMQGYETAVRMGERIGRKNRA